MEKDAGHRREATSTELAELNRLKHESAEMRQVNDILKAVAHFFRPKIEDQSKR